MKIRKSRVVKKFAKGRLKVGLRQATTRLQVGYGRIEKSHRTSARFARSFRCIKPIRLFTILYSTFVGLLCIRLVSLCAKIKRTEHFQIFIFTRTSIEPKLAVEHFYSFCFYIVNLATLYNAQLKLNYHYIIYKINFTISSSCPSQSEASQQHRENKK